MTFKNVLRERNFTRIFSISIHMNNNLYVIEVTHNISMYCSRIRYDSSMDIYSSD